MSSLHCQNWLNGNIFSLIKMLTYAPVMVKVSSLYTDLSINMCKPKGWWEKNVLGLTKCWLGCDSLLPQHLLLRKGYMLVWRFHCSYSKSDDVVVHTLSCQWWCHCLPPNPYHSCLLKLAVFCTHHHLHNLYHHHHCCLHMCCFLFFRVFFLVFLSTPVVVVQAWPLLLPAILVLFQQVICQCSKLFLCAVVIVGNATWNWTNQFETGQQWCNSWFNNDIVLYCKVSKKSALVILPGRNYVVVYRWVSSCKSTGPYSNMCHSTTRY